MFIVTRSTDLAHKELKQRTNFGLLRCLSTLLHPRPGQAESCFHFLIAAPTTSGPEDFQYYVTTTEFTEEAILMKVQASRHPG